jgi:hypothetical protein
VVVVGDREDAFAGVGGADSGVVHAVGAADADLAFGVEPVVSEPVVSWWVAGCGEGFGDRSVGLAGCAAVQGTVRAVLVVVLLEGVELVLELGEGPGLGARVPSRPTFVMRPPRRVASEPRSGKGF